jgi:hypothetical protein
MAGNLPTHPDSAREGLREAAERRKLARRDLQDANLDLSRWISEAQDAGLGVTEIAQLSGITRRAIYDVLAARTA